VELIAEIFGVHELVINPISTDHIATLRHEVLGNVRADEASPATNTNAYNSIRTSFLRTFSSYEIRNRTHCEAAFTPATTDEKCPTKGTLSEKNDLFRNRRFHVAITAAFERFVSIVFADCGYFSVSLSFILLNSSISE